MIGDDDVAAHLQMLEEELLRAGTRRDQRRLATLIADDFREFGASGRVYNKTSILAELAAEASAQLSLADFACQPLASNLALVTYRSTRVDADGTLHALRSSLWIHRDGRWQILFHQGTRV